VAETLTSRVASHPEAEARERPQYEPPRIQVLTEREVLSTFQITQSMAAWWATGMC
jgi:hypothetical protein